MLIVLLEGDRVALLAAGVDRNNKSYNEAIRSLVALLAEGVDRNERRLLAS